MTFNNPETVAALTHFLTQSEEVNVFAVQTREDGFLNSPCAASYCMPLHNELSSDSDSHSRRMCW